MTVVTVLLVHSHLFLGVKYDVFSKIFIRRQMYVSKQENLPDGVKRIDSLHAG